MRSIVMRTVDLTFKPPSSLSQLPSRLGKCNMTCKVIALCLKYVFLTLCSLFRFPGTCLQCQQHNRPLPSNEGCRLPFNVVEGSLVDAEGYRNARGHPCCGRPMRFVRRCDSDHDWDCVASPFAIPYQQ